MLHTCTSDVVLVPVLVPHFEKTVPVTVPQKNKCGTTSLARTYKFNYFLLNHELVFTT